MNYLEGKNETILPNSDGQKILYVSTPSLLLPPMSFPWAGPLEEEMSVLCHSDNTH